MHIALAHHYAQMAGLDVLAPKVAIDHLDNALVRAVYAEYKQYWWDDAERYEVVEVEHEYRTRIPEPRVTSGWLLYTHRVDQR